MLISLSSRNEPSNADFQNYFSEALVIPANSYIGLINASFTEADTNRIYNVVEPDNRIQLAFNTLDLTTDIVLPVGSYTIEELQDTLNVLCANLSTIWKVNWIARQNETLGDVLILTFYRSAEFWGETGSKYNVWALNSSNYAKQGYTLPFDVSQTAPYQNPETYPTANAIVLNSYIDGVAQTGAHNYVFASHYDIATYPKPPVFDIWPYQEDCFQSFSKFSIMSANTPFEYRFGSQREINGGPTYALPNQPTPFFKMSVQAATPSVADIETDPLEIGEITNVGPSSSFRIVPFPSYEANQKVFNCKIEHWSQLNATAYSLPMDFPPAPAPTLIWNVFKAVNVDFDTKIPWHENSVLQNTDALWNSTDTYKGHYGAIAGTGESYITTEFLFSGIEYAHIRQRQTVPTFMPNRGNCRMERVRPAGYTNPAIRINNAGINDNFGGTKEGITSYAPTLFSIGFSWTTDGDYSGITNQQIFGKEGANILSFDTATQQMMWETTAFNWGLMEKLDGTPFGGFQENVNYQIGIATRGDNIYDAGTQAQFNIYIAEQGDYVTNDDIYRQVFSKVTTDTFIAPLTWLGGITIPTNASTPNSFNGAFFDFNVSQMNDGDTRLDVTNLNKTNFIAQFGERCKGSLIDAAKNDDWWNIPQKRRMGTAGQIPITAQAEGHTFLRTDALENLNAIGQIEIGNFNFTPQLQLKPGLRSLIEPRTAYDARLTAPHLMGIYKNPDEGTAILPDQLGFMENKPVEGLIDTFYTGVPPALEPDGNPPIILEPTAPPEWTDVSSNVINVNIENLPHRTYNGETHSMTKSIMSLPQYLNNTALGNSIIRSYESTTPRFVALNNSMDINFNQLEVRICDSGNVTERNLTGPTHLLIEIKTKQEIQDTF